MRWRRVVATAALVVAAVGCTDAGVVQRQAVSADDGIQATGRLEGRRVAISAGEPEVLHGDCDPGQGPDTDLCIVTRTIAGTQIVIVVENPAVLQAGSRTPVVGGCADGCDDRTDGAHVVVRVDGRSAVAVDGSLAVHRSDDRYAADFRLRLADGGDLSGSFDVRVRPAPASP